MATWCSCTWWGGTVAETKVFDTLSEFHLQSLDLRIYALMIALAGVINNPEQASELLGEAEAARILQIICRAYDVDYLNLIATIQQQTNKHITPRILLHILILPVPYVSEKLQIDQDLVAQLLDQLHHTFTIDDPIDWLKNLLHTIEKSIKRHALTKENQLHGLAVTEQPLDTAEERKLCERKLDITTM